MDPDRWHRTQRLFEDAVERPAGEQQAFVVSAAGGDEDLVRQVLALLEADARATFLDADVGTIARDVLDDPPQAAVNAGMQVGPYRLKDTLGEGGSGVVYVATRDDIGHDVAIKILRDAWVSDQRRGRFEREQRTLAKLNHPSIARIFDAGVLDGGTPWFAMELVAGMRLDEYCRQHATDRSGIVRLVREIAAAVQHAHERLIVHRDLKPTNIVVTADGVPKLLDFGIARGIEGAAAERAHTVGLRMLTPGYASPEELRGEPPGVQSDVYSLGVILRELLAAAPDRAAAVRGDWLGTRAHRRDRTAGRDLDVICRTATHDDQALRYATADALVRDLDAWLAGRPLAAGPVSGAYRLRRFVSRNRRGIAAAVLVLAALTTVVTASALRIAAARAATDAEAARSDRLLRFLLDLFEGGDQGGSPAADLRVVALLDRGVREAETLEADPKAQADLFGTLGQVYRELGEHERSDSLLTRALALRRARSQDEPMDVVRALVALSALRRAQARYDDAETLAVEALSLTREVAADAPLQLEARAAVGRVQSDKGQYATAAATLEDVIQRYGDDPGRAAEQAVAVKALADAYFYLGDMDRAERESSRALELHRQSRGLRHPEVGQALVNLGAIASVRGKHDEAERHFREATAIIQTWFGEGHPETASAMTSLGQTLRSLNRLPEARDLFERARATQERVFGPLHPRTAFVYNEIGILAFMADDFPAAETAFAKAIAAYAATHHPQEPVAVANLGSVFLRRADYPRAEREFVKALAAFKGVVPDDHVNVAIAKVKLGRAILRQHRPGDARPLLEAAEPILAAQPGPESTWLKAAREDLALLRGEGAATKP